MSAFVQWFEAQHGPRTGSPMVSDADLRERIEAGRIAKRELRSREEWDRRQTSALYAWQIRDDDKK